MLAPAIFGGLTSGRARIGDPPDSAMALVSIGLSQVVLQVTNQRVVPIDQVEGAIRAELQIDRPKVPIVAGDDGRHLGGEESSSLVSHRVIQDSPVANHIVQQVIALGVLWEVST